MSRLFFCFVLASIVGCSNGPAGGSGDGENGAAGGAKVGKGVILLRYSPGSESTEQRENGFLETMKAEFPDVPILSDNQYAGTSAAAALEKSQQLLLKYGCLLYTSPSPRDATLSRMPSSA